MRRGVGGSGAWVGRVDGGGIERGGGGVGRGLARPVASTHTHKHTHAEQETAKEEVEAAAGEENVVMGPRDKSEEIKSTEMAVCLARAISGGIPGIGQVFVYIHPR